MVIADWHIHTAHSFDSKTSMEDVCREALRLGIAEICFTDHQDVLIPPSFIDFPRYKEDIARMKALFPQLIIHTGIELGDIPAQRERLRRDLAELRPDYFLLSTHVVGDSVPYRADEYYANRTRAQGISDYLQAVLDAVNYWEGFHALAHLGYAARYAPKGQTATPMCHVDGPELIDAILRRVISVGAALEMNTGRADIIPGEDILRRYRHLGGKKVVLGSDAHDAAGLARNFASAEVLALSMGFSIVNRVGS